MEKQHRLFCIFLLGIFFSLANTVVCASDSDNDLLYEWQLERLFKPSEEDLVLEQEGRVFIYDGVKDSDINKALDLFHERIGAMMFINTVWTDADGKPLQDAKTGNILADDDC